MNNLFHSRKSLQGVEMWVLPKDLGAHCLSFLIPEEGHRLQRVCRLWSHFLGKADAPMHRLGLWQRNMIALEPWNEYDSTYCGGAAVECTTSGTFVCSKGELVEYTDKGLFRTTHLRCDRLLNVSGVLAMCAMPATPTLQIDFVIRRLDGQD